MANCALDICVREFAGSAPRRRTAISVILARSPNSSHCFLILTQQKAMFSGPVPYLEAMTNVTLSVWSSQKMPRRITLPQHALSSHSGGVATKAKEKSRRGPITKGHIVTHAQPSVRLQSCHLTYLFYMHSPAQRDAKVLQTFRIKV